MADDKVLAGKVAIEILSPVSPMLPRPLCVFADRAARPGLDTAENRGFST
jgi:hypothetical protein